MPDPATLRLSPCAHCGSEFPADGTACPYCGRARGDGTLTAPVSATAIGGSDLDIVRAALVEDYEITGELGRGGMAIVLRGRERALDREVAIKVLPLSHSFDAEFVERFQHEARIAAGLEHPHIVPIYRVGRTGRVIYFVMKYLRGGSLSGLLKKHGALPPARIVKMLREVGSALQYAAERGVVHRDIKPDNIMLDESGRYAVTDFGIAKSAAGERMTATGMSIGTPRYMSPEQARAKPLDGRSDIYSLGIVAYECLTGRVPFDAGDNMAVLLAHVQQPVPRPTLPSAEHQRLFAVIERMLAKDTDARFQQSGELLAALEGDAAGDRTARVTVPRSSGGGTTLKARIGQAGAWATASRTRLVGTIAGVIIAVSAFSWSGHVAITHRSQCPRPAATGDSSAARTLTLMVDPVPAQDRGDRLDVYYDVCGLDAGTTYHIDVAVTGGQRGLKKLLGGGAQSVKVGYDEVASGPRIRRHRTVDTRDLGPGGYAVTVSYSDGSGRTRTRRQEFRVTE